MRRWWAAGPRPPVKVEAGTSSELHYVRSLRDLSDQRLRLLEQTGESRRVEELWNRLLISRESDLAAAISSHESKEPPP
jgi:hypothetical protein